MPITRAFCYVTFRVPSKGAPSPDSLHRAPIERDAPFPEPPFNYLSEFPVNGPPMILKKALVEKGASLQNLCKAQQMNPLLNSPLGPPWRVMSIHCAALPMSFWIPTKEPP
jgi:hypothetical protein